MLHSSIASSKMSEIIFRRRKSWVFRVSLITLALCCLYTLYTRKLSPTLQKFETTKTQRCVLPQLDLIGPEMRRFIHSIPKPNCLQKQKHKFGNVAPFEISSGKLLVRNSLLGYDHVKGCCYTPVYYNGNDSIRKANYCTKISDSVTPIPDLIENIQVNCHENGNNFADGFSLLQEKPSVETRISKFNGRFPQAYAKSLNVLILGIDSTSQMNFLRHMPHSKRFLTHNLSAILLKGYTKVGDNTVPNLIPLLTGLSFKDFRANCTNGSMDRNISLENCPFIWKTFAQNGYHTSIAEDDPRAIESHYFPEAFESKPPVDYYWRTTGILLRNSREQNDCLGSKVSMDKILDYVKNTAEVFGSKDSKHRYFQLAYSVWITHDSINKLQWGDMSLLHLLEYFETSGRLNKTALIIMGDHGFRNEAIRNTRQGRIEYKMPVAYIVLPKWFEHAYPQAYQNLKQNAEGLTSHYDMHKTLYDFINLDRLKFQDDFIERDKLVELPNNAMIDIGNLPGTSLFSEMPTDRTCYEAGISLQWCTCYTRKTVKKSEISGTMKQGASFIVDKLNELLEPYPACAKLKLTAIEEVRVLESEDVIREKCMEMRLQSLKRDPFQLLTYLSGILSGKSNDNNRDCERNWKFNITAIEIRLRVQPGGGRFEATVFQFGNGTWNLPGDVEDVIRISTYGAQSKCVEENRVKPNCYCKHQ